MRNFSARETEWLEELDGIELATFWRRAFAFAIDWVIVVILVSAFATISASVFGYLHRNGTPTEDTAHIFSGPEHGRKLGIVLPGGPKVNVYRVDEHTPIGETIKLVVDVLVPVLYFGILLWRGKGRTPGKRLMRVRVVSIVHQHLSFWHSVERALGYGAAALEGGFGFIQFFIHPYRRCAQDRLAETIVVTERGYRSMQHRRERALLPDTNGNRHTPE